MDHPQRADAAAVLAGQNVDAKSAGQERPDDAFTIDPMVAEQPERVAMAALHQRVDGVGSDPRHRVPYRHHALLSPPVRRSTSALNPLSGIGSHFGRFATS